MKGSLCCLGLLVFVISPSSSVPASSFDSFFSILDNLGGTKSGTVNNTSVVASTSKSQTSSTTTSNNGIFNYTLVSTKTSGTDNSCEEYVDRYLLEAISDLKLLTTNFTALLNKLNEIRVMIIVAELTANNLTSGVRIEFEKYLQLIDLALSAAVKKAPNCVAKGEAAKTELVLEVNKKIELALKTLVTFQEFKAKIVTINYRLTANSIDASVTKMKNCGKNLTVSKLNWRIIISCINDVTKNFQIYLNAESVEINLFASEVKKQKTVILSNLTSTFSRIQLDAENKAKVIVEEIMKCVKLTPSTDDCVATNNKSVSLIVKQVQLSLDKLGSDLIKVKEYAISYAANTQSRIEAAIRPLVIALNATLRALPNVNLTKQQIFLENLISEAKRKLNVTVVTEIIKYLNDIFETNGEYSLLSAEFREKVQQFSEIDFNTRCKRETVSDEDFCSCVEKIFKEFTDSLKSINSTINRLNDEVSNLTSIIDININSNITNILNTIFNISNTAAIDIYNDHNITDNEIIEYVLLNKYNVTSILDVVTQLYNLGKDLEKKRNGGSSEANYTIITAGSAIYDIVGPGRAICPHKSNEELLKKAKLLVSDTTTFVYTKYPYESSTTVTELLQLADDVNSTLFNQIALLNADRLKQVCQQGSPGDKKKLFEFYQCLDNEVKKFGVYFTAENSKIENYVSIAQDKVKRDLDEVMKWKTTYVTPEATAIVEQLKNESERFYHECNATVEKLINFSLTVANSYYNFYEPNVNGTYADIITLALSVLSRDYSTYNISSQLGAASQPVVNAISTCVPPNATQETIDEYRLALAYIVGNATEDFRKVIANFSIQSLSYKEMAAILVKKREEIFKNHTYSYLYNLCYNPSSPFPFSNIVSCTTPNTYRNTLLVSNNTLTSLIAFKKDLVHFDSDYERIIQKAAESILEEFTLSAAYFAYRICQLAGKEVPAEVLAKVQRDRCLQGVTTNKYYCVITT